MKSPPLLNYESWIHPCRVCAFLAGNFNLIFPQPKYRFIWNVQTVIDFIRKEWEINQELSDEQVSCL